MSHTDKLMTRRGQPIATSIQDCLSITSIVESSSIIFGCCHVLRYTPYNRTIKRLIDSGILGQIINIQHLEPVG